MPDTPFKSGRVLLDIFRGSNFAFKRFFLCLLIFDTYYFLTSGSPAIEVSTDNMPASIEAEITIL